MKLNTSFINSLNVHIGIFCLALAMLTSIGNATAEPIEVKSTEEPYTAIESIALPDLTNDGFGDFGIFYLDSVNNKLRLQIIDGVSLARGSVLTWNNIYAAPSLHLLPDFNDNNVPEIGVFGVRTEGGNAGKPQMLVKDLLTGGTTNVYNWPANWTDVKPLVLDDINGDNFVDVAIQGVFKEGTRSQLVIRDGQTGGSVATYSYPDLLTDPEYFQHSDTNGDGVREIATFGRIKKNNKIQVKIADGANAANNFKSYNFPDNWSNIEWITLDDKNNDDVPDWGLFGVNKLDGRPQLTIKSGTNPVGAIRIFAWSADISDPTFLSVPDMNNDGINEVAAGGIRTNGRHQFQVKDGANRNVSLANHNLNLAISEVSYHVLGDLTGDGIAEIGFFGIDNTSNYVLQVQNGNGVDGTVTQYNLGSLWSAKPLVNNIEDINSDGLAEILFKGRYAGQTKLQIWAIPDADSDSYPDTADAFPSDEQEWLDTDNDNIGNNEDDDDDNDGIADADDEYPLIDNASLVDSDGDGIMDNIDPDIDGDTVLNDDDAYPNDPNRSFLLPEIFITSPLTLTTLGNSTVNVTGTLGDNVTSLTVNGSSVLFSGGAFSANVGLQEGSNTIVARVVDNQGISANASISVSLDLTAPYITIDSHTESQTVYTSSVDVTGLVNDIVRGTIEAENAQVIVNGVVASIGNRSYIATAIPLSVGSNNISVSAADQVGNVALKSIKLIYEPASGSTLSAESGQGQTGIIESVLTEPLTVRVISQTGSPIANEDVIFRVTQGSGMVGAATAAPARAILVKTDSAGIAATSFKLGQRAGAGNHKVTAAVVGFESNLVFNASAVSAAGNKLSVNSGNNQRSAILQQLPSPFVVVVTDEGNNTVQNSQVQFVVEEGNGSFENGESLITKVTDSDGRASAHLTLGSVAGLDRQRAKAYLLDGVGAGTISAGFTASGFVPGDPGQTSITGLVLDNQDEPIAGVTVRVEGTNRQAVAASNGQFTITEVPVGPVHLIADGSTANDSTREFPSLSYNLVTVPGVANPLATPIYMVAIDTSTAVLAGASDVVLTLPDLPGFKLEIAANSVTFPDGSKEGLISVTPVNANKVPMPPPNGMQPQLIVTIQPAGTRFYPPAKLTLPNVDGHTPGAQVEMYSFDHDLEEFVTIGLGTVTEDGALIASNTGVGVIKAGWHCGSPPGDDGDGGSCGSGSGSGSGGGGGSGGNCPLPDIYKGPPPSNQCSGNPIDIATGNKYERETDYVGPGPNPVTLQRFYNGSDGDWRFSVDYSLEEDSILISHRSFDNKNVGAPLYTRVRTSGGRDYLFESGQFGCLETSTIPGGPSFCFTYGKINPITQMVALSDPTVTLQEGSDDYTLTLKNGEKQYYTTEGRISQTTTSTGYSHFYAYTDNQTTVSDDYDNKVVLTRDSLNQIERAEIGDTVYQYSWDTGRLMSVSYPDATTKQYHYEDLRYRKKLTGITDERGIRYANWQYDNSGRAILSEHANETDSTRLRFNFDGSVTEINPLGKQTVFRFEQVNGEKRVVSVEGQASPNCAAANKGYTYDGNGRIKTKTDWAGVETLMEYNDRGLETRRVEANGTVLAREILTEWHDTLYVPIQITEPGDRIIEYSYDSNGRLQTQTIGERTTTYTYSIKGLLSSIDGPRADVNDVITFAYDTNANLTRVTNAVGLVATLADYSVFGQAGTITDANGVVTTLSYDLRGRLTQSNTDGSQTQFGYDKFGQLSSIIAPDGQSLKYEYDDTRRLAAIENAAGERVELTLDPAGNITQQKIKTADGQVVFQHLKLFDELSRLMENIGANGESSLTSYDVNNNPQQSVDGRSNASTRAFDELQRVKDITDPLNGVAGLSYDVRDNLASVTDQRGLVTTYTYNIYNEIIEQASPDTGITKYEYDTAGNLLKKTDARNVVENMAYDAANRITAITYPSDSTRNISFSYDAFNITPATANYGRGMVTAISDHSGSSSYVYDKRGNLLTDSHDVSIVAKAFNQTLSYQYDSADKVTEISYPVGLRITYKYDSAGQITEINARYPNAAGDEVQMPVVSDALYLPNGPVQSLTWGNDLTLQREYDQNYWLTQQSVSGNATLIYNRDANGNITSIDNSSSAVLSASYQYDELNRIAEEVQASRAKTYNYDAVGNRLQRVEQQLYERTETRTSIAEQNLGYAETSNRLTTINDVAQSYDANGNLLEDGEKTYVYDARNRMQSVSAAAATLGSYTYHGNGQRRIKQTANGSTVFHYGLSGELLSESVFDNAGTLSEQRAHIFLNSAPVGYFVRSYLGATSTEQFYFVSFSHINTALNVFDLAGNVLWENASDSFGLAVNTQSAFAYSLRFPGQYFDAETGSHYNYFRDYRVETGRYVQSDPIGILGGLNTFSYVENNPVMNVDPFGLKSANSSSSSNRAGGKSCKIDSSENPKEYGQILLNMIRKYIKGHYKKDKSKLRIKKRSAAGGIRN
jgi:RHS repeat-associated protein